MPISLHPSHDERIGALHERLRLARTMTPELMADVMADACPRLQTQHPAAKARVLRLIESGAFADATLTLIELELPQWKLRRLVRDEDEWHCALSRQLALPAELDDMAEGIHESLHLAMLSALVAARRISLNPSKGRLNSVPQVRPAQGHAVCCDNFA
jgi:hypothetical protein